MLFLLLIAAAIIAVAFAIPASRTFIFKNIGVAKADLSDLLGKMETLASDLEDHAKDLLVESEAEAKKAAAALNRAKTAEANATRAQTAATNIKTLVAAP